MEDGDQDGTEQIFKISSMKIHENFDMETVDYDVCVLTVRKNLELRLSIFTYSYFSSIIIYYLFIVSWCY